MSNDTGCVACIRLWFIGPCHAQQRGRSRAQIQHEGGSRVLYPDHEEREWAWGTLWPRTGDKDFEVHQPPSPSPHQGRTPSHPLQVHTPPPAKVSVEASLGGNHTSASDLRSEAMEWARGGCGDHFELFSTSLGGQTAELVTSTGWPVRFSIALLSSWLRNPWQANTTRTSPWQAGTTRQVNGRPVWDRSLYKESPCTFLPLSNNTRKSPHLQTPRRETLPTRSEE